MVSKYCYKWDHDIKIVLKEIGCDNVDWIKLAQNMLCLWDVVYIVMNLWILQKAGDFFTH